MNCDFDNDEINDDFIRDYLKQQSDAFSEPFVEKKARQQEHNDMETEFQELLAEITKDEELIRTFIELCAFLLDKTQQERMKNEEDINLLEQHITSQEEIQRFEQETIKQYQKMHNEQNQKINNLMESIEKLEKELADKENQVAILNQQQTKRGSIIKKEKLRQLEEIQKEDSNLIETLKGELSGLKKVNANLKQEMIYYQKNHDEQQNKIETQYLENQCKTIEKVKLEGQLRRLEVELTNIYDENEKLEFQLQMSQEQVISLRTQLAEIEQQMKIEQQAEINPIESQLQSMVDKDQSEQTQSNYQSLLKPKNLKDQGFESHRMNQYIDYKERFGVNEVITEESSTIPSNYHSKKTSKFHSGQYTDRKQSGQFTERKIDLNNVRIPLEKIRESEEKKEQVFSPQSARPILQEVQEKRLNKLKLKLENGLNSVNQTPRVELFQSPRTDQNIALQIDLIPEDEFDGQLEQKVFQKQKKKQQLNLPKLALNSKPEEHYSSFLKQNQDYIQHECDSGRLLGKKLEKLRCTRGEQESLQASYIEKKINKESILYQLKASICGIQKNYNGPTKFSTQRDPYKEFFDLVKIQLDQFLALLICQVELQVYG